MNDFETRLKNLHLKRPPVTLEEDIFGPKNSWRGGFLTQFRRPVQLGWAAAFALLMMLSGYSAALGVQAISDAPPRERIVEIRVVDRAPAGNDFDFTGTSGDFLSGEVSGSTTIQETI